MNNDLATWRKQIDTIDDKILRLLAERMNIAGRIGKFKRERELTAFDKDRWQKLLTSNLKKGKSLGMSQEFVKNLLDLIHKYSIEIQNE